MSLTPAPTLTIAPAPALACDAVPSLHPAPGPSLTVAHVVNVRLRLRASADRWAIIHDAVRTIERLAAAAAYLDKGTSGIMAAADIDRDLADLVTELDREGTRLTLEMAAHYVQTTPRQKDKLVEDRESPWAKTPANAVRSSQWKMTREKTKAVTREDLLRLYAIHGNVHRMAKAMGLADTSVWILIRKHGLKIWEMREYRP